MNKQFQCYSCLRQGSVSELKEYTDLSSDTSNVEYYKGCPDCTSSDYYTFDMFSNIEVKAYSHCLHLAKCYHANHYRKYTGGPYVLHPIDLANHAKSLGYPIVAQCALLLHDLVEDFKPLTMKGLYDLLLVRIPKDFTVEIINMVIDLTDVYTLESFPTWNRKKRKEAEFKRLLHVQNQSKLNKILDVLDNADSILKYDYDFAVNAYIPEVSQILEAFKKIDEKLEFKVNKFFSQLNTYNKNTVLGKPPALNDITKEVNSISFCIGDKHILYRLENNLMLTVGDMKVIQSENIEYQLDNMGYLNSYFVFNSDFTLKSPTITASKKFDTFNQLLLDSINFNKKINRI
jgi:hypothetical protein